jgi:1,4-dihydroxy-2-naphthoate octaprenyltransferase
LIDTRLIHVIRPHIVVGGLLGYLVGALYALNLGGDLRWTSIITGYLVILFIDLSTHFNNNYYDVEIDRRASFKPFGSDNILVRYPELRLPALYAAICCTIISLILAAALVITGTSWLLLAFTIVFNALGWLYSTPPVRLHSRRLGEATIALGTGLCIPAVGYMSVSGGIDQRFLVFTLPLILYGFMLSLSLQIPDYEVDREMGKNTIVGLIGRKNTYRLVLLSALAASVTYLLTPMQISGWGIILLASLLPATSSLYTLLRLTASPEDARKYTKISITSLFLFLTAIDLTLLLGLIK